MAELPDEWRFLTERPQPWVAPSELNAPTNSSTLSLLVQIVTSDIVGNDGLGAAGRVISSYAALNMWIVTDGRRALDFEGITRVSVEMTYITRDLYSAWNAYREIFEPARRADVGRDERRALIQELENSARRLDRLRQGNSSNDGLIPTCPVQSDRLIPLR